MGKEILSFIIESRPRKDFNWAKGVEGFFFVVDFFSPLAGPHKRNRWPENCPGVTHSCVLKDSEKEKYYFSLNHLSACRDNISSAQEVSILE